MRRLLAIESSGPTLGLAALADGEIVDHVEEPEASRHVETIVPLLDTLMRRCEWRDVDVEAVAVAEGPGSFTGLRVGMAAAKAIALAHDAAVVSVRTLEAWAITELFLRSRTAPTGDMRGDAGTDDHDTEETKTSWASLIVPVLDARKRRFYTAAFRAASPNDYLSVLRITEDRDISAPELLTMVEEARDVHGEPWCAPGPHSRELGPSWGAAAARAAGGSAVVGVALRGSQLLRDGIVDDAYHGPFYLREGDIGSRRPRPVFKETPHGDTKR